MTTTTHSRARIEAIGAAAVPIVGIVALHRLSNLGLVGIDWSDPVGWIRTADAEQVLAAGLRLVGLVVCYWLALSTVIYVVAVVAQLPAMIKHLTPITPLIMRRMADRMAAGAVAISTIGAPAALAMTEPPPAIVTVHPIAARTGTNPAAVDPYMQVDSGFPPVAMRSGTIDDESTAVRVEVRRGDTLWKLAEQRLSSPPADSPSQSEISAYWRRLVAVNLPTLTSGDPDLIHPGEIIVLP